VKILVLCVTFAMLALGVLGCQQAQETVTEEAETTLDEAVDQVKEDVVLIDPACGMEVTMESEWTAEYEGVTFYFCSESCKDKFVEEPTAYLKDKVMEKAEELIDS
jgi:YHS domain-containing protein